MVIGTYILIITLNVNGLNAPTKRHRLAEWIQKQDPYICCLQETHLRPGDTYRLKVRGWKEIFHANGNQRKAGGLPWWRSGWESACQCRGHGFKPWSGRIPRAAERLGPWATIAEPARLEPVLRNKGGRYSERPAHRDEEWPPLAATGESPRAETRTQHSHKWMNK